MSMLKTHFALNDHCFAKHIKAKPRYRSMILWTDRVFLEMGQDDLSPAIYRGDWGHDGV